MKKLKIVWTLATVVLLVIVMNYQNGTKKVYKVISGDTTKMLKKSNLPVDIKYTSEQVDVNEISNVNIIISSPLSEGSLKVKVKDLKNSLEGLENQEYTFVLSQGTNSFPLNFQVLSEVNGIHYISLIFSVEGKGIKSLSIPVNIGKEVSISQKSKITIRNSAGTPLSVSQAEEVIR